MGLFDDIVSEVDTGVKHVGGRKRGYVTEAKRAWKLWIEETERPDSKMPKEFETEYIKQREQGVGEAYLKKCVAAASYLRPHQRDARDIRRVISCMKNNGTQKSAIALHESGSGTKYLWETMETLETKNKSTIRDLEQVTDSDSSLWSIKDTESAGYLMELFTADELLRGAKRVKLGTGALSITPNDLVTHIRMWNRDDVKPVEVRANAKKDTYQAGTSERDILKKIDVDADPHAEKLIIKGCPAQLVLDFHLSAPSGYWDNVNDIMDEDELDNIEDVYDSLMDEYDGFVPSSRKVPTW